MERRIVGFHQDAEEMWVAELECGHDQHVRHRPPFETRPWVLTAGTRAERIGTGRNCPLCERSVLPERLAPADRILEWDETSLPDGVRRAHRLPAGRWAVLEVESGTVRYTAAAETRTLAAGDSQAIPPGVPHDVEPLGSVRLRLELFRIVPASA